MSKGRDDGNARCLFVYLEILNDRFGGVTGRSR